MTDDQLCRRMDAGRVRAELTVQDLWLRYLALGGTNDAFDIDGYLQGLVTLDPFEESVLAQSVNEALTDSYNSYCIPLFAPTSTDGSAERLRALIHQLLDEPAPARQSDQPSRMDLGL